MVIQNSSTIIETVIDQQLIFSLGSTSVDPSFYCMVVHIHVRCGISLDYARILALSVCT